MKKLDDSEERALFMGLDQVKELTRQTIQRIIRFAPFTSLEDFLTRVDPRAQEAENLASCWRIGWFGKNPLDPATTAKWRMAAKSDESI